MKAISLWQPWATLMALGLKKIETRSWPTKYRGPLAIHAALKIVLFADVPPDIMAALYGVKFDMTLLPYGGIIATVDLIDCVEITKRNQPAYPERGYGDYRLGRFMWITDNVKPFKKIIPFRGRQGLFNVPDEALRVCRVCGCSEFNACPGGCALVEEDLCSACADKPVYEPSPLKKLLPNKNWSVMTGGK